MTAYDHSDQLPELMQQVTLSLGRTSGPPRIAPTRILDVEVDRGEPRIVVACPAGCDASEHHFDAALSWTDPTGRFRRTVVAHPGRRRYGAVWVLTPTGPALRAQDRSHFRARMDLPARLTWRLEPEVPEAEPVEQQCAAVTIDLSEGGVLVLVRAEPPAVGTVVDTTILVDGTELASPATVVRHMAFPGGTGVGLMFPDSHAHADRLRRIAWDAERRRVSRGVR